VCLGCLGLELTHCCGGTLAFSNPSGHRSVSFQSVSPR